MLSIGHILISHPKSSTHQGMILLTLAAKFGYHKTHRFTQTCAVGRANNKHIHRVIDANFRLHGELQAESYSMVFLWKPQNVLMSMCRRRKKENDTFCTLGIGMTKSVLPTNSSTSNISFMVSVVILQGPVTHEYIDVVVL